jgi:4-amino-4-deoxy-L-arabinose transferase-like glycosyltransferase
LLLGTLVFTATLGVVVAIAFQLSPFGTNPALDEGSYVQWGLRIAGGDWFGSTVFYQEPLYPYFLAVVFRLANDSLLVARLLQVAISTGTTLLVYRLGARLFSANAGLVAAVLYALVGVVYLYSAELIKETLGTHLSAWVCLLGIEAAQSKRARLFVILGALYGALMLLRGNFVAMLPLLLVWAAWLTASTRRWALVPALLLGLSVPLAPVALRNHAISHEWVLTTSQGGQNFFIGNSEYANGLYAPIDWVRATPIFEAVDFQKEAERRVGHALKPGEVSAFWFGESFAFLTQHPVRGLELTWRKVLLLIHAYEIPDNYSLVCMRQTFIPSLAMAPLGVGWLVAPALLGVWLWRRQRSTWFAAAFMLTYGASVVAFFVVSRYRMPALPGLSVFAGAVAVKMVEWAKARTWPALSGALGLLACGWLLSAWPLPFLDETGTHLEAQCSSSIGVTLSDSGRHDEAVPYLEHAQALRPDDAEIAYDLGVAYQGLGRLDEARRLYAQTLAAKPGHAQAAYNAGLIELAQGHGAAAVRLIQQALDGGLTNPGAAAALQRATSLLAAP